MTERGLPSVDGAPACPFVAFADDREGRATSPDHRHRCFAETPPAPRAAAHQEAYCLSSAFPVCPTFQDWARREAAHAKGAGERAETAPTAVPSGEGEPPRPPRPPDDLPVRRNPPRDWAAPPPWASGAGGAGAAGAGRAAGAGAAGAAGADPADPEFLASRTGEGHGLAGSAADWLAGGPAVAPTTAPVAANPSVRSGASPAAAADDELADLVRRQPAAPSAPGGEAYPPSTRLGRRPAVSSTRPTGDAIPGPSWERMKRYEAYPTIRARAGLPGIPRLAVLAGALVIAALVLFMLPALLGIGGGGGSSPSPNGSGAAPTASAPPTPLPAPTAQVYVIKDGDLMSKLAKTFGVTLEALCAANKEAIPNCDKISVGQEIIIPEVPPDEFTDPSASAPAP